MNNSIKYFLTAVLFWFVVDFTTTEAIKNPSHYYSIFMPALLIFYIGYPLVFSLLFYKFKLNNKLLFIATLMGIIIVEILFTHNTLLYTFPIMILTIPVAISIYGLITFVPKWIVEGKIKNNKVKLIIMIIIYVLISLATLFGSGGS